MAQKNSCHKVNITSINSSGFGVCRVDGVVCFVAGGVTGDELEIKIIKSKKNYNIGKIEKIITPSPKRQENDCDVFKKCGGCCYRHVKYEDELEIKETGVRDAFTRIGHLENINLKPIIPAESSLRYRNKAQYPVKNENGKFYAGFFASRTHDIIPCDDCLLQPEIFSEIVKEVCLWAERNNIPSYDEKTNKGTLRHIYLRIAEATNEVMLTLVSAQKKIKNSDELIETITKKFPDVKSIILNINSEKTNVILGEKCITLYGNDYITDVLCDTKIKISPLSFYQVNRRQAEKLYNKAKDYMGNVQGKNILDLYCGTGTIGLCTAKDAAKLIGVEIIPEAIEDAKENAKINGRENTEFICGDAEKAAEVLKEKNISADIIIVDPPRKGLTPKLIETISDFNPEKVVYVSCDPATLARDCGIFRNYNFEVIEATPVDLFPRTSHCETVALLSQQKARTHINIDLDLDDLDITSAETKATYNEIKEYVLNKYGFKVTSLNIAQTKTKLGIIERENYNKGKEGHKVPPCPKKNEDAIIDALRHFKMI